jgi:Rap1a immunity proteins
MAQEQGLFEVKRPTSMTASLALALALALTVAPPLSRADAPSDNVQELLGMCNAEEDYKKISCLSYVSGIGDAMLLNGKIDPLGQMSICAEKITYGAMEQAFKNWAQKHPERWGHLRYVGVIAALRESWPCKAN